MSRPVILLTAGATAILATTPAWSLAEHPTFIVRSGVMMTTNSGENRLRETRQIYINPAGGSNWCFVVDPSTQQPYEVYSVHRLPSAPRSLWGGLSGQAGKDATSGVKSKVQRVAGKHSFCYQFDPDDPIGTYQTDVHINNALATTIELDVVAPMRNESVARSRRQVMRLAKSSCPMRYQEGASRPSDTASCAPFTDAEAMAAFPGLAASDQRIAVCPDPFSDSSEVVEFVSQATESHEVMVKRLDCNCYCDRLECDLSETPAVYDATPEQYFHLGDRVSLSVASQLVRMFSAGRLVGLDEHPEWKRAMEGFHQIRKVERRGRDYLLTLRTCTCGLEVLVRLEGEGDAGALRVLQKPGWGCV